MVWLLLPPDYVIKRALPLPAAHEQLVSLREGLTEVISVTEIPGTGRTLVTNGHPMSSTRRLSQRYMRALAHIPLLSADRPESVLVTASVWGTRSCRHAPPGTPCRDCRSVKRHPELSSYFGDANQNVLSDSRVVSVRQRRAAPPAHAAGGLYDLITLEPPPIAWGWLRCIPASSDWLGRV